MRKIGGLFGRSPFGPLYEHAAKVRLCLELLAPILQAFTQNDRAGVKRLYTQINRAEAEADQVKSDLRDRLSDSIFTAVERTDVLSLLSAQDDVADACLDLARVLDLRETLVPPALREPLLKLGAGVAAAVNDLVETVGQFRAALEGSLERSDIKAVVKRANKIRDAKDELEEHAHQTLRALYAHEAESDPVSLALLTRLIGHLAKIADETENTADCVARIIGRR